MIKKTKVFFTLLKNVTTPYKTSKITTWTHWIGIDEAENNTWKLYSKKTGNLVKRQ